MKKKVIIIVSVLLGISLLGTVLIANIPHIKATQLVKAIKAEDCNKVKELLEDGVDPNVTTTSDFFEFILNIVEASGERPLTVACKTGNLEIVELLIAHGATAELSDKGGWSPLQQTLFFYQPQDTEIVKLLLKKGAQLDEGPSYEPLVFEAAEMLPRKYDKDKSNGTYYEGEYDEEVAKGITVIVSLLLEHGNYDINLKSSNDATLLMYASESGNKYLVQYLISAGCDISATDKSGKTALDYATAEGHVEIADILLNAK